MTGPRIKKYFITHNMLKAKIDEFLAHYFYTAGYAGVELFKTPTGHRVVIYAEYPGKIIGRGGSMVKKLTRVLQVHFGLENPNITATGVPDPDLNARVIAFRIVRALEKEIPYRRVALAMLRRIMEAGAIGAEIVISGKLRSERAKYEKLKAGRIYKAGEHVEYIVDRATARALLKRGVYGVEVMIVKPGIRPADYLAIRQLKPEELEELKATIETPEGTEEVPLSEAPKEISGGDEK